MHYHILLSERCNSECRYCYGKSLKEFGNKLNNKFKFDFTSPESFSVDLKKLKKFIDKDKDAVIIFYGGEPLLEIDTIKKIIDAMPNVPFRMQTNGKLLNDISIKYLNKIKKLLVSIDGDRERTDYNKGKGTYDLIMKNLNLIKKKGYSGEIIARMTISEFPDLFEQVMNLLDDGFENIHWQLDAGFFEYDFDLNKFSEFVKEYNRSVTRLIDFWIEDMRSGRVLRFYPFIGIVDSLLNPQNFHEENFGTRKSKKNKEDFLGSEKNKLRCGAGYAGYAITTDGKVVACPIMNCIEDFKAGTINDNPDSLKKFDVSGRCLKCEIKDLCGGRCLYWNRAELWPKEGDELICKTIFHLINEIKKRMYIIEGFIKNGVVKKRYFEYEKYFGPEIIP